MGRHSPITITTQILSERPKSKLPKTSKLSWPFSRNFTRSWVKIHHMTWVDEIFVYLIKSTKLWSEVHTSTIWRTRSVKLVWVVAGKAVSWQCSLTTMFLSVPLLLLLVVVVLVQAVYPTYCECTFLLGHQENRGTHREAHTDISPPPPHTHRPHTAPRTPPPGHHTQPPLHTHTQITSPPLRSHSPNPRSHIAPPPPLRSHPLPSHSPPPPLITHTQPPSPSSYTYTDQPPFTHTALPPPPTHIHPPPHSLTHQFDLFQRVPPIPWSWPAVWCPYKSGTVRKKQKQCYPHNITGKGGKLTTPPPPKKKKKNHNCNTNSFLLFHHSVNVTAVSFQNGFPPLREGQQTAGKIFNWPFLRRTFPHTGTLTKAHTVTPSPLPITHTHRPLPSPLPITHTHRPLPSTLPITHTHRPLPSTPPPPRPPHTSHIHHHQPNSNHIPSSAPDNTHSPPPPPPHAHR